MTDTTHPADVADESLMGRIADEYMTRLNRGERVEIDEYVERYPRLATYIRQVFPAFRVMGHSAPGVLSSGQAVQAGAGTGGQLGDYRIIREVGRGGMGVVYEAEQVSLGRRVALKVLPFAAVLDSRQLQRFKNEAHAAAQLHHQNIVPVFSVGCERGVHYYAMQYVEGSTLGNVIRELRQITDLEAAQEGRPPRRASELATDLISGRLVKPKGNSTEAKLDEKAPVSEGSSAALEAIAPERSTRSPAFFRSVANLGVQAAEALEHAHELGVVHRDIKPSNLLLDTRGNLWITDFGLARLESDASLTLTGDVLGTLRYMSPEQAAGRHLLLDHRTDIYSLGVTLYELLTLKPAFDGRDRHELLRKIADDDPRQPRRINAAIPADLETIILKATAKEPQRRYVSAKEFAKDLERFLDDKPIRAKRPSLLERVTKWSRRHKSIVVSAVVLLAMAVAGLSVSTALIWQEQARTAEALTQAEDNLRVAETHSERAELNFQLAREAVDQMLTRVAEELEGRPHMQRARRELLEDALAFYEQFLEQEGDEPAIRLEIGRAYGRAALINEGLGNRARAEEAYGKATSTLEGLVRDHDQPEHQVALADAYSALAGFVGRASSDGAGRLPEAEQYCRKAMAVRQRLVDESPDEPEYRKALASSLSDFVIVLGSTGRFEEAEEVLHQSQSLLEQLTSEYPDEPEYRAVLASAYTNRGALFSRSGRMEDAVSACRQAAALMEQVVSERCERPLDRQRLAGHHRNLAFLLLKAGRMEEAEPPFRRALELLERLSTDYPDVPMYQEQLAWALAQYAYVLEADPERSEEAEATLRRLAVVEETLIPDLPDDPKARRWCSAYYRLAKLRTRAGESEKADEEAQRAIESRERLVAAHPSEPKYREELARTYRSVGGYFEAAQRHDAAEAAYRRAVEVGEALVSSFPDRPPAREHLGHAYRALARFLANCPDPARRSAPEAVELAEEAVELLSEDGDAWTTLGVAHYRAGDWAGAIDALDKSLEFGGGDAIGWFFLALAHQQLGDQQQAAEWYARAARWLAENPPGEDELRRVRAEAAELLGIEQEPSDEDLEESQEEDPG